MLTAMMALAIQAAQPTPTESPVADRNAPLLAKAVGALRDGLPQTALDSAQTAIDAYERDQAGDKRRRYCGMSGPQVLLYMGMAAKDKTSAVALGPGYCTALFLKGYALVDLGRIDDARTMYDRVLTLAPFNAQYLSERGQLARLTKDWPTMLDFCRRAEGVAGLAPEGQKILEKGAALRCQGYALVEQKQWDEATARYNAALAVDANDDKAKGELHYIADHRGKPD